MIILALVISSLGALPEALLPAKSFRKINLQMKAFSRFLSWL